uniref:Odorant receptor n=1 Tax=Microplitis mediator TaxID=375433 RepID=M1S0D3_9HYME|nr:olfactory receptor 12 [Microplitis mediator]
MIKRPIETHRKYLDKCIHCIRFCGIWKFDSSASTYHKLMNLFGKIFNPTLLIFHFLTLFADIVANYNDLIIIADDGCFLAGSFTVCFKAYEFHLLNNIYMKIINDVHDSVDVLQKSCDLGVLTIIKQYIFFETLDFFLLIYVVTVLGVGLIVLLPLTRGGLPVRAIFPFDVTKPLMHKIAFFIQAYNISFGLVTIVALEYLSWGLMRWTIVQLKVLSSNYRNCNSDKVPIASFNVTKNTYNKIKNFNILKVDDEDIEIHNFIVFEEKELNSINDCFNWRFRTCIRHHQRLIKIIYDLNDIFTVSLLIQLGVSTFLMCLNGYLAFMFPHDNQRLIRSVLYLVAGFVQLLYWCGFGNELKFQANDLTTSQWMSGWEDKFDGGIKNLVTTSMIRTMQPLEVRAGGLFILSMETFLSILKTSYSVFVLLTTVSDEE